MCRRRAGPVAPLAGAGQNVLCQSVLCHNILCHSVLCRSALCYNVLCPHRLISREKYALKMIVLDERMRCIAISCNGCFGHTPLFILKDCWLHDWLCTPLNGSLKGYRSICYTKCDIFYAVSVEMHMFSNWTIGREWGCEHKMSLCLLHRDRDMIPQLRLQSKRGDLGRRRP